MERQEASEQREREEQEQGERKESLCWEWRPVKGRWEAGEQGEGSGRQMR